jgi:hypothetical protein
MQSIQIVNTKCKHSRRFGASDLSVYNTKVRAQSDADETKILAFS